MTSTEGRVSTIGARSGRAAEVVRLDDCVLEIVSDSGEGAQKAGQIFGIVSARMGNGAWTLEIIPAEIRPPPRSRAGASGIRVRIGSGDVTNMGDTAHLVVALNEQVVYSRVEQGAYGPGTQLIIDSKWADDDDPGIRRAYREAIAEFRERGLVLHELPIEAECRRLVQDPRVGKNMFVLGMLGWIYSRDLELVGAEVAEVFAGKGAEVIERNRALLRAGADFARERVPVRYEVPGRPDMGETVVMNGNQAFALGVLASGIEVVSIYPITPATSVSHHLASVLPESGGLLHQAEDEIAAIGFAIGASYAGRTACTITSGPGLALKTEFLGLAVMAEVPLVLIVVQRGGPSTGLPTKVEQGDLLSVLHGTPGDAPKIVLAPATIEECFHSVVLARRLAEEFRSPVVLLSDANLATGVQPFARPHPQRGWLAPAPDPAPWPGELEPYAWDPDTGLSPRPVPGRRGGEYVLTGLAHTRGSKVAYDPESNRAGLLMRSRKIAALARTLVPPTVHGDPEGDLLVVGWGSTLGAIEEAVDRLRGEGHRISALHLRFLSPLEPGLEEIFARFRRVMTVELNYGDPPEVEVAPINRRHAQLASLLRSRTLVDIDSHSVVDGQAIAPGTLAEVLRGRLAGLEETPS